MQYHDNLHDEDDGVMNMSLETYYRILKHDPDGRLVKDTGLLPSHSYVIQFMEVFYGFWHRTDINATDVDGNESVLLDVSDTDPTKVRADAGVGSDVYGLVVGTNAGASAEDNLDYALDTKILHSAVGAAGKLNYQATTFVGPRAVGANIDMDVTRTFLNESGSTITVKEIGIIIRNTTDSKYHLILRDVVSDEDVLDGYTLTVVYTLRTTA